MEIIEEDPLAIVNSAALATASSTGTDSNCKAKESSALQAELSAGPRVAEKAINAAMAATADKVIETAVSNSCSSRPRDAAASTGPITIPQRLRIAMPLYRGIAAAANKQTVAGSSLGLKQPAQEVR